MKVRVYDEDGRTWETVVNLLHRRGKRILSFGYPMEYDLDHPIIGLKHDYPLNKDLYIDALGHNNYNSPVFIKKEDINQILKEVM